MWIGIDLVLLQCRVKWKSILYNVEQCSYRYDAMMQCGKGRVCLLLLGQTRHDSEKARGFFSVTPSITVLCHISTIDSHEQGCVESD